MLLKTHLSITLFFALLLLPLVESKFIFLVVALIATFIPDIDSRFSTIGHKKIARILQFFTKHRGIIHSFTLLLVFTLILVLFFPSISLGFFLGYALHLFADSFTKQGIRPFYPFRKKSSGKINTGSKFETFVFVFFIVGDIFLLMMKVF